MSPAGVLIAGVLVVAGAPLLSGPASDPARRLRLSTFDFYSTHTAVAVDVEPTGAARLSTVGPKVEVKRKLTPAEAAALIRLIEEVGFFGLESEYGTCAIDGLGREIRVELDGKKKRVGLCSVSTASVPPVRRKGAVGAWRVWNAARMLFPDHYPEQSRHDADELLSSVQP